MNSTNSSEDKRPFRTPSFSAAIYTMNILLTVLGNYLICWVVYRYQRLRTPDNMLLASLSCANMLNVVVFVSRLIIYFSPQTENSAFCSMLTVLYNNILLLTTLHLCIISIDRMLAIKYPLRYPLWVTNRRALFLASSFWVICAIRLIGLAIQGAKDDFWKNMARCHAPLRSSSKHQSHTKGMIVMIFLTYIIPFMVMLTSYGMIFKVVKGQLNKAHPETEKQAKRISELKAVKTIGLLVGAFVILYTPLYIGSVIHLTKDGQTSAAVRRSRRRVLRWLGFLSSCACWINPVIYASTNKEVKEHLKKLFNRICRKNN